MKHFLRSAVGWLRKKLGFSVILEKRSATAGLGSEVIVQDPQSLSELDVVRRTLYGEARGQPIEGIKAVASVIMNRAQRGGWWGETPKEVCLKPFQFSCWNKNDPNRQIILQASEQALTTFTGVAKIALEDHLEDNTFGSTHYLNPKIAEDFSWSRGREPAVVIADHAFYNDVE